LDGVRCRLKIEADFGDDRVGRSFRIEIVLYRTTLGGQLRFKQFLVVEDNVGKSVKIETMFVSWNKEN
jgi:hypothetical protein